jgi:hypothetical protein
MPRKLTVIAIAGLGACIVCLGAAAVVEVPRWSQRDWDNLSIRLGGLDACRPVPGATSTSRSLAWTGGDAIRLAVPGTVHYRPGDGDTIRASGDPEILAHLRVRHRTLGLDCQTGFHDSRLDVTLPGRPFRSFTLAGSGHLMLEGIDQPRLDMIVAGSGTIDADGKADRMKIRIAGSGTVTASGEAKSLELAIAGSGDARLGKLAATDADIDIAGSGDAEIAPQERADVKIAGSGDVRLFTEPKTLDTRIFGSGRIRRADR